MIFHRLLHGVEHGIVTRDSWALLLVLSLGVAHAVKVRRRGDHRAAKPDGEPLQVGENNEEKDK